MWGSWPRTPLEGQNNSPRRFEARKNFLGQALPPPPPPQHAQKPSYGPGKGAMVLITNNPWQKLSKGWDSVTSKFQVSTVHKLNWKRTHLTLGGGGKIRPLLFFLHHPKTAQGIMLKLSDFKDTPLRHILQVKPVPYILSCCHGNKITKGASQNLAPKKIENQPFVKILS